MSNARTIAAAPSHAVKPTAIRWPQAPAFGAKADAVLALFRSV